MMQFIFFKYALCKRKYMGEIDIEKEKL